jgi:hypothetical protein
MATGRCDWAPIAVENAAGEGALAQDGADHGDKFVAAG